jgi:anaerobic selenocysteine-containing dehydrogenase
VWAELCAEDAAGLGAAEGDVLEICSARGRVRAPLRIGQVRPGTVFLPFHYGYWDTGKGDRPEGDAGRAANELTITDWDPVSKQPLFKTSAARVEVLTKAGRR